MARKIRDFATSARDELRSELGEEYADLELRDLDPRTIVRKHIIEAMEAGDEDAPRQRTGQRPLAAGEVPPYDAEST
jgi:sec-independent protein translocase protein TatB